MFVTMCVCCRVGPGATLQLPTHTSQRAQVRERMREGGGGDGMGVSEGVDEGVGRSSGG